MTRMQTALRLVLALTVVLFGCAPGELSGGSDAGAHRGVQTNSGGFDSGITCVPGSCWCGPYNIYTNNCHNAANCGVESGSTGILSCTGSTDGLGGHTVNYNFIQGTFPCSSDASKTCGQVCLSEPQSHCAGGAYPDQLGSSDGGYNPICCWEQDASASHPQTGKGEPGETCYRQRCRKQSRDHGGVALPPGESWPTSVHHAASCYYEHGGHNSSACRSCCADNAAFWDHYINKAGTSDQRQARQAQKNAYLKKCRGHCSLETGGIPVRPVDPNSGSCAELEGDHEDCQEDVMETPRNDGANHFCYAQCSAKFGAPDANQIDLPIIPASPAGDPSDNYHDCVKQIGRAICDQWFSGMPPAGVSFHYLSCFYDCMRRQAERICGAIGCARDGACGTKRDAGCDGGADAGA